LNVVVPFVVSKFSIQCSLAFVFIIGWAVGRGVEDVWTEDESSQWDLWWTATQAIVGRVLIGVVLFVVVVIEIGFEALGVGLGGH
jgi:hypothetical protein